MVDRDKYVFPFGDSELISRMILNFESTGKNVIFLPVNTG